jgi:hypothetical protein
MFHICVNFDELTVYFYCVDGYEVNIAGSLKAPVYLNVFTY